MNGETRSQGPGMSAFWAIFFIVVVGIIALLVLRAIIGLVVSIIIPALVIAAIIFVLLWVWNKSRN